MGVRGLALHGAPGRRKYQRADSGKKSGKLDARFACLSARTHEIRRSAGECLPRRLHGPCQISRRAACPLLHVRSGCALHRLSIHRATRSIGPRPRCCIVSSSSTIRSSVSCGRGRGARYLVPAGKAVQVDRAARHWLAALYQAGIELPSSDALDRSLVPFERLAQPAQVLH